jgi:hypothetical protein
MNDKLDFKRVLVLLLTAILVTVLACVLVISTSPTYMPFTATASVNQAPPPTTPPTRPSRNNGSPCDPNTSPPPPPTRNAGINANPPTPAVTITLSLSQHPETAAHIQAAQAAGHPRYLTIDRAGNINNARRNQALVVCDPVSSWERDEYPPAMFREGGQGASVRYVEPTDNGGAGARTRNLLQRYPDGTIVEIKIVP